MATGGDKCGDKARAAPGKGGSDDLYAVLGLSKECSDSELKVAYRKLAMRWHPDRCSSSSSREHLEEAKEKFQQIQGAYSVLSDANKRFLYDVGVYEDDDNDDSLQGMGDFLGEMAHMMSQTWPTRQESFEELQQLFVDMFQSDLDSGFCNVPDKGHQAPVQRQTRTSSTSPSSSPSPPPPLATEAEAPSCNGINKRGSSAMGSGKPPQACEFSADQRQSEFCFGNLQSSGAGCIGWCSTCGAHSHTLKMILDAGCPDGFIKHEGQKICKSDTNQAPKVRGGSTSRRRNGQKQKLSSKHDVSSEDEMSYPQQHRVV